jgi:hypothetical protein
MWRRLVAIAGVTAAAACAYWLMAAPLVPTADSYVAAQPNRQLAGADFRIGAQRVACGKAHIVLDPELDDLAAAYPGIIIMNSKYLPRLPDIVGLYAFGHECGHQLHGPNEEMADCYAVMRGEAQGWLNEAGLETICTFWKPFAGDNIHLPGAERCALMRSCFARATAVRH